MYFIYKKHRIFYEKYGTKKDVLLILPGWGEVKSTYTFIIDYFKDKYSIYYIDYPGFGKSKPLSCEFTVDNYAEMIFSFLRKRNITSLSIIAHSFGGRITSLLLGKYHYPCHKLILMDVAGIKHFSLIMSIKKIIYKGLKRSSFILPSPLKKKYLSFLFHKFSSEDYLHLPSCMRKTFQNIVRENLWKYYRNISSDTLLLWGENDLDTPLKDGYILRRIIQNSGLVVFPHSGHFSYFENSYSTLLVLSSFLKK